MSVLKLTIIELFQKILNSPDHVLHPLLRPPVVQKYNVRSRPHNRHLTEHTSRLTAFLPERLHTPAGSLPH